MNKQKIIDKIIIATCITAVFSGIFFGPFFLAFLLSTYDPITLFLLLFLLVMGGMVFLLTECYYDIFKDRLPWRKNKEEHHE